MHLAELNIAEPIYDLEDPRMADFVNNLDRVNAMAERMPGFVWRLKDDSGNATGVAWPGNPETIVNLSVWETPEQLQTFVFNTLHREIYKRRAEWFSVMKSHAFVMWWVEEGHIPSVTEAHDRLERYNRNGAGDDAFGWDWLDLSEDSWRRARCA